MTEKQFDAMMKGQILAAFAPQDADQVLRAPSSNCERPTAELVRAPAKEPADPASLPIADSGERLQFPSGSLREVQLNKGRYDLLPMEALRRLAVHFEKGALKYADENWRKGQPTRQFASSAMRHLCKFMQGYRDEDHLAAVLWNVACLIETQDMIARGLLPAELDDLPDWTGK